MKRFGCLMLLLCSALWFANRIHAQERAQQAPAAVISDPPPDPAYPATMAWPDIPSHGAQMYSVLYIASGASPHPTESYAEKAFAFYVVSSRDESAAGALARCQSGRGKNCVTATAPCAGDDIRWSSPLPLPPGWSTATVDPNMVGTWELFINPGRWIWRVAPNGTYEVHSEAMDNTPSNAGTFSASNGHYKLHAIHDELG